MRRLRRERSLKRRALRLRPLDEGSHNVPSKATPNDGRARRGDLAPHDWGGKIRAESPPLGDLVQHLVANGPSERRVRSRGSREHAQRKGACTSAFPLSVRRSYALSRNAPPSSRGASASRPDRDVTDEESRALVGPLQRSKRSALALTTLPGGRAASSSRSVAASSESRPHRADDDPLGSARPGVAPGHATRIVREFAARPEFAGSTTRRTGSRRKSPKAV